MTTHFFLFFFALCTFSYRLQAENEPCQKVAKTTLHAVGTIYPQYKSALSSQVAGRVEEVYVEVGDRVKKGSPLVKLDPIFFKINVATKEAALAAAQLELKDSRLQLERMKKLWEKPEGETPSIPQKRFDDAKSAYEQAIVSVRQASANLKKAKVELDEAVIKAPFDGVVTERLVDPGVAIAAGPQTKVLELQSHDLLYVEFPIAQTELCRVQEGNQVLLDVEGSESSLQKIDRIYPHVDVESRTIKCRVYIRDNTIRLRPGSLVKVRLLEPVSDIMEIGATS